MSLLRPDEIRLSSILGELLDPDGRHAQGRKFWDLFVKHFNLPAWSNYASRIRVQTEVLTDGVERTDRRIDLLVEIDDRWAIAVENKPWAADQDRQVADYLAHLHVRYPSGHTLIYLSGTGDGPTESSISDAERTQAISAERLLVKDFGQLIPWLTACRHECEAPTVAAFLKEFEDYIRAEFLGVQDMAEQKIIIGEATRNAESIEAAIELIMAGSAIKEALLRKLPEQILERITERGHSWSLTPESDRWWDQYQGFTICLDQQDRYGIRFQFEQAQLRGFFFGIKKDQEAPPLPEVCQALDREFNCRCKVSDHWAWWRNFDAPLYDWNASVESWQQVADGRLAERILGLVGRVYQRLRQDELLTHLSNSPRPNVS
ncbi:PD-(D/E)XK nuclease family protein [Ralstonia insidiosa]|uniref:PD-(D/E)XK nuclease family protein n=1 Tax=Ralstonia insidiosa TaxID=190721 RepID=A0A848P3S1_9RALS|nr:PD-(D/E)XK nuclease family protein [Ralstonia insidiosa]NMV41942.1 PD-(D/E)XK nuclease family protein [Ralstonia insidiosa]